MHHLFAAEDWTTLLDKYGAVGLLAALVIFGVLVPRFIADRETKRADAAEERERLMRDKVEEKILPLLADVARELAEFVELRRRER